MPRLTSKEFNLQLLGHLLFPTLLLPRKADNGPDFLSKNIPLLEGNFPSGTFEKLKCFQNLFLSRVVASFFVEEKWMAEGRADAPRGPLSESEDQTHRLDALGWSTKHLMAGMFIKEQPDEASLVG